MTRQKHVPQRTCVGCRTTSSKREFTRVVRTPEGAVEVDATGRRNGRGAYLCAQRSCWEEALTRDRLARALRTEIPSEARQELLRYAERFEPATVASGS
ncbi:MAG: YlxR family protein [Dehalococcoidia bacterium]|nr:YlxR family protein [Dehalococcoidia bacterium]